MSAANQFVSQLIRAANGVNSVDATEQQRLLNGSVVTIRDMQEQARSANGTAIRKTITDLQDLIVAAHLGRATGEQLHAGLLAAACLIRELHISIDRQYPGRH
ncbi:hypothetical protein [Oryzifoliimicrobium ureilyticus]|uniref:hypothetical protein n=1 Tax=Oryzifoliimicrobium ureilyticus TaxID=3113724 RepID=UPI0030765F54